MQHLEASLEEASLDRVFAGVLAVLWIVVWSNDHSVDVVLVFRRL